MTHASEVIIIGRLTTPYNRRVALWCLQREFAKRPEANRGEAAPQQLSSSSRMFRRNLDTATSISHQPSAIQRRANNSLSLELNLKMPGAVKRVLVIYDFDW